MDLETSFQKLLPDEIPVPDGAVFVTRLHQERIRRQSIRRRIQAGSAAGLLIILIMFGSLVQMRLPAETRAVLAVDNGIEDTLLEEILLEDAALYLVLESDDIWSTLEFFAEIDYQPVIKDLEQTL